MGNWQDKKSIQKQAILNSEAAKQQSNNALESVQDMQRALVGGLAKVFNMEKQFRSLERGLTAAEWRYMGISELLQEVFPGFTAEALDQRIEAIQIREFNLQSAEKDAAEGLLFADNEAAQDGFTALFSAKFYDENGVEESIQRVVRSRVQLGKKETTDEIEFVLSDIPVGTTASLNFTFNEKAYVAEITLLGLRKPAPSVSLDQEQPQGA